jgi:DNA-binding XRE family transcriptional regulator
METSLNSETKVASVSSSPNGREEKLPSGKVIAQELKAARERIGLSREQARKLLGHHDKQFFYRWEGGKRRPDLNTTVQLCVAYRYSLEELCPSLWRHYSQRIESRRVKSADEAQKPTFRREVAHRTRNWE